MHNPLRMGPVYATPLGFNRYPLIDTSHTPRKFGQLLCMGWGKRPHSPFSKTPKGGGWGWGAKPPIVHCLHCKQCNPLCGLGGQGSYRRSCVRRISMRSGQRGGPLNCEMRLSFLINKNLLICDLNLDKLRLSPYCSYSHPVGLEPTASGFGNLRSTN